MNPQCYKENLLVNYFLKKIKKNCKGWTQWALVPPGTNLFRLLPCGHLKILLGINQMGLSAPCTNSLGIIAFQPVKNW